MRTIFTIIILGGVTWFSISNASAVTLRLFLWEYSVSLALIVVVSFLLGFILGILRLAPGIWSRGASIKQTNKKLSETESERDELTKRNTVLEEKIKSLETTPQVQLESSDK